MPAAATPGTAEPTVRRCRPGEPIIDAPAGAPRTDDAVLWVDVEHDGDPADLCRLLGGLGVEVSAEQVAALLARDDMPLLEDHGSVRNVSLVGLTVTHDLGSLRDITFHTVETLVGDAWLVTCWQHSRVCAGTGADHDEVPELAEAVRRQVADLWVTQHLSTAGDLATAHALALTKQYRSAFSRLEERLRAWEREFHLGDTGSTGAALKPLIGMVNETQRRLAALNDNRALAPDGRWFAGADAELDKRADHYLDRMLERLTRLADAVRADMELVSMEQMVRAAAEAEAAADRDETFNTRLGVVTAFLLVPTLIAGIFGANTALPGQGHWSGFVAMVVLMAVSGPAVWWLISRRPPPGRADQPD